MSGGSQEQSWVVNGLRDDDRAVWEALYRGYAAFYEVHMPAEHLQRVWSWLHDATHELDAVVVRPDEAAAPVGLAHIRPFARPLAGSVGLYLDDLFVAPEARGRGAVGALFAELRRRARANGWDVVRWITQDSNARARTAYDRVARRTEYLTYDMTP